jgi:hypothetical protein
MALIRGIHCLAHGDKGEARRIAEDIRQHQRLLVGENSWGSAGVYAWYTEELPPYLHEWPQVLFEIDDQRVVPIGVALPGGRLRRYFRIPGRIGEYVSITVLGFAHLD